ncbi:DUF2268 domain-containing protein [Bacillus sp. AP8]|nr:DUF2268 domain-containing putative Zn-dependent protease [Bacillus sp. AP8]
MGMIKTEDWLVEYGDNPLKICNKLQPYFEKLTDKEIYHYLQQFGMYHASSKVKTDIEKLQQNQTWEKVEDLFLVYQEKWKGPDIPIFIFPHRKQPLFIKGHNKSGLAFPDKLFLFLSPKLNQKDREALLIHEYHHVCRLHTQKKSINEYTIADSIILEGLAEYTVEKALGSKYLAPWTKQYTISFLDKCWKSYFQDNTSLSRNEKKHDQLIYGRGTYPAMIGYCMGYYLVDLYFKTNNYSNKISFHISPEKIIENYIKLSKQKEK